MHDVGPPPPSHRHRILSLKFFLSTTTGLRLYWTLDCTHTTEGLFLESAAPFPSLPSPRLSFVPPFPLRLRLSRDWRSLQRAEKTGRASRRGLLPTPVSPNHITREKGEGRRQVPPPFPFSLFAFRFSLFPFPMSLPESGRALLSLAFPRQQLRRFPTSASASTSTSTSTSTTKAAGFR